MLDNPSAPLLGPSLGPILGGILTQAFNWHATFWLLVILTGLCAVSFIFFKDTFRHERSLAYQAALKRVQLHEAATPDLSHLRVLPKHGKPEQNVKEETISAAAIIVEKDTEAQPVTTKGGAPVKEIKLTLKDVNPVGPILRVLRRPNNIVIIIASGLPRVHIWGKSHLIRCLIALLFGFEYSIIYTASITLAKVYHYDALKIGAILLAFGAGSHC